MLKVAAESLRFNFATAARLHKAPGHRGRLHSLGSIFSPNNHNISHNSLPEYFKDVLYKVPRTAKGQYPISQFICIMDASALFYICYFAKALAQAIIFFIWLADSTSETIQYIAAVVTLLAICPFFHVTTQALSTRPTLVFSATYFKAYLCFR